MVHSISYLACKYAVSRTMHLEWLTFPKKIRNNIRASNGLDPDQVPLWSYHYGNLGLVPYSGVIEKLPSN